MVEDRRGTRCVHLLRPVSARSLGWQLNGTTNVKVGDKSVTYDFTATIANSLLSELQGEPATPENSDWMANPWTASS
jgi:hypothetical protein